FSNLAYEGGEYVYSGLLLAFGVFLFGPDAVRLFRLVSLEVAAQPDRTPLLWTKNQKTARLVLKGAFVLLAVVLYGFTTATTGPMARFPKTPGLPGITGVYRVTEFRQDGKVIPYSKTPRNDGGAAGSPERSRPPTRWQDVVFETWNTVSIRSNAPVSIHHVETEELPADEQARNYELAGSQGRHYYRYTADASGQRLTLKNANPNQAPETLQLTLTRATNGGLILSGVNHKQDSVYAVLTKVNKKYLLQEAAEAGRRGALTL
ncbi:MAG: DoxX family protein, partial [Bacteroidetes bacterium]|nr:DoxX family protein [Fibrella sp.]